MCAVWQAPCWCCGRVDWADSMWRALLVLALALAGSARVTLARPPTCAHAPNRCNQTSYGQDEYSYTVDGMNLQILYTESRYFSLVCPNNLTLDNLALPRFESELRVTKVFFTSCPVPHDSYGAVLQRLNVRVLDKLRINLTGVVTVSALAGLPSDLAAFELFDAALAPGALASLAALRRLHLDRVRLPPGELLALPLSLQVLLLKRMGEPLPAAALQRLPALVNVTMLESRRVDVQPAGALQGLSLEMPGALVPAALPPALRRLTLLRGWGARLPPRWEACAALRALVTMDAAAEALPADWLRRCTRLEVLHVRQARKLSALHATSLRGARRLRELLLTSCALRWLPTGLLDDAVELSVLDLSDNRLHELPGGLFAATQSLHSLNLSKNKLTTELFAALSAVTSLNTLHLSHNVELKDSCGGISDTVRGTSPLQYLKKLTELHLRNTSASLICRDWRENMPLLETLDLGDNNITAVTYTDLQFSGKVAVLVNLGGNDVSALEYTREDYGRAAASASRATVRLGGALRCDCGAYWAARALREHPAHVALRGAACGAVPLDELLCGAPALCGALPACACGVRAGGAVRPARRVRVRCERGDLSRVSHVLSHVSRAANLSADEFEWDLRLAHNRIADLTAADIPKHLSALDLSYNNVSEIGADVARALLVAPRRVWLAHNPLLCECGGAGARAVLLGAPALQDRALLACRDGTPLGRAPGPCGAGGPGAGAVAAAAAALTLLAGGALGGLLAHPALRLRLKAALHRRGWLPAAPEPDAARRYDAFVSFSHGDERFVRTQLVARLEAGARPYRLCLHYRDWAPGGWIPAQIAASVRASRRTLAVVSEHFLRSGWARAEFRAAHALALRDARPRLVVVLLDAPERLPLDASLRRFLAANTYVRWGDPYFWEKLELALPRARRDSDVTPRPALGAVKHDGDIAPPPAPATVQLEALVEHDSDVTPAPTPDTVKLPTLVKHKSDVTPLVAPDGPVKQESDVTPADVPLAAA